MRRIPCDYETKTIQALSQCSSDLYASVKKLERDLEQVQCEEDVAKQATAYKDTVLSDMDAVRQAADLAEALTSKEFWPFPTYTDLLYSIL